MKQLQAAPVRTQRILFGAVVGYFASWIGSIALGSSLLGLFSAALFGVIAIGVGALLFVQADDTATALSFAGVSLALGGLLELVWVGGLLASVSLPVTSQGASLFVFVGIAAYVYAVWIAD